MTVRSRVVQGAPAAIDESFPTIRLRRTLWFRAHLNRPGPDRGCWHYASRGTSATSNTGGRFDLVSPRGTCYFAATELAAARERLGRPGNVVSADEVTNRIVTKVRCHLAPIANLLDIDAARHGVTRELTSAVPYTMSQQWAEAFDAVGFAGIHYQPRFSTDDVSALAVFGHGGVPKPLPPIIASRPMADVLREHGYVVLDSPSIDALGTILD